MSFQTTPTAAGALRLHYNENTAGCSPKVIEALRSLTREDVAFYPDYPEITARTATWLKVDPSWVQLTNGLDDGIHLVAEYGAWHGDRRGNGGPAEFVIVQPAFEMYQEFADIVGARVVPIAPEPEFQFPLVALLRAINPNTRVIYLTDPNNPTGLGLPPGAAETIAQAAPHALVVVDEAYADFSGRTLIGRALERHHNLVVGRTFAKGHGLAALRIGALVAHPETLRRLQALVPPFAVNIAAVRALEAALDDQAYLDWYVAQAKESRERVYAFCRRHQLHHWPSEANFVLFRLGDRIVEVVQRMKDRGFVLRDKSAAPGCSGCLRFAAGVVEHTQAALTAMEDILASRTH